MAKRYSTLCDKSFFFVFFFNLLRYPFIPDSVYHFSLKFFKLINFYQNRGFFVLFIKKELYKEIASVNLLFTQGII